MSRRKLNCWEFKNCGRERGGVMVATLGECPVAKALDRDGLNSGIAAGRVCWIHRNHQNRLSCLFSTSHKNCFSCEFYKRVCREERELTHIVLKTETVKFVAS